MNTKIEKMINDFVVLSENQKKELCLHILSKAKARWGLFQELYSLVEENRATEFDLLNIYQSAMEVLEESREQDSQEAMNRLEETREKLKDVKEKEEQENLIEQKSAQVLLNNLI